MPRHFLMGTEPTSSRRDTTKTGVAEKRGSLNQGILNHNPHWSKATSSKRFATGNQSVADQQ